MGNPGEKLVTIKKEEKGGLIRARLMEIDLYLTEKRNNVVKKMKDGRMR